MSHSTLAVSGSILRKPTAKLALLSNVPIVMNPAITFHVGNRRISISEQRNFASVYGNDGKTSVGTKYVSAAKAWRIFAGWYNKAAGSSLTGKAMSARCKRYKESYKKALTFEPLSQVFTSLSGVAFRNKTSHVTKTRQPDMRAARSSTSTEVDGIIEVLETIRDDAGETLDLISSQDERSDEGDEEQQDEDERQEEQDEEEQEEEEQEDEETLVDSRTSQRTGADPKPNKFMNYRSKATSVSTALFPSVLRREPSGQSTSTSKGSQSHGVRLKPPPAPQDLSSVSTRKAMTFGEAFMKSMEMKLSSEKSIEIMKLEYQKRLMDQTHEAEARKARAEFLKSCVEKGLSLEEIRQLLEMADGVKH
ncbi:hypothetical protein BGZ51_008361 [Haplosporangium sp. Z 767]|nr:hypothetical protein BGZ51_008361 [Haplosporangium sp. Z 767]